MVGGAEWRLKDELLMGSVVFKVGNVCVGCLDPLSGSHVSFCFKRVIAMLLKMYL